MSAVAEIERENIRVQTMEGRIQKAREGKWNGGFAPYGYSLEKGQLFINEEEAEATKEIFKLEPLIFHKLKQIQEKSLLGFLNLLLSSEERENVLTIIEQVVELSPQQRTDFSMILKKTSLENIIDTNILILS